MEHRWFAELPLPETVPAETLVLLRHQYTAGAKASADAAKAKHAQAAAQAAFHASSQMGNAQLEAAQRMAAMIGQQQQQGMGLFAGMMVPR